MISGDTCFIVETRLTNLLHFFHISRIDWERFSKVINGVPRGSVLWPILFLITINNKTHNLNFDINKIDTYNIYIYCLKWLDLEYGQLLLELKLTSDLELKSTLNFGVNISFLREISCSHFELENGFRTLYISGHNFCS